jgi:hypothetical protein
MNLFRGSVIVYPYKSFVSDPFMVMDADLLKGLHTELAATACVSPDNHVVYELRWPGTHVFIGFSDHKACFSHSISPGHEKPLEVPTEKEWRLKSEVIRMMNNP